MVLEKQAPLKERYVWYNQTVFTNKNLQNLGIDCLTITTSECEKLLRIYEVDVDQHVTPLCQ